jgi:charged multivesicular body protein 7
MKSYESSTATLRAILSHPSLQRESVDKTLEALAEANADARELDNSIRIAGDAALGVEENVDEGEVEAEWAELVRQMSMDEKEGTEEKLGDEALKTPTGVPHEKSTGRGEEGKVAVPSI